MIITNQNKAQNMAEASEGLQVLWLSGSDRSNTRKQCQLEFRVCVSEIIPRVQEMLTQRPENPKP